MPESDTRRLRVSCTDEHGHPIRHGLVEWLRRVAPARVRGAINIALVSDARMRSLNRKYRRKNYATDVLSFPANGSRTKSRSRGSVDSFLGDIVIARGVAARQARSAGHSTPTELRVLALHGLLHLMGYDHERDRGEMKRVEARLRAKAGLTETLIERADRRRHLQGRSASVARVGTNTNRRVLDPRERSTPRARRRAGDGPRGPDR
jgi:probable rRNA maturation factor